MTRPLDKRAEKIKQRKEAKAALRAVIRDEGIVAAAKMFALTTTASPPIDEECQDCARMQNALHSRLGSASMAEQVAFMDRRRAIMERKG